MGILFSIGQFLARGRPQTHEKGSSNSPSCHPPQWDGHANRRQLNTALESVRKQVQAICSGQFVKLILKAEVGAVRKGLELTYSTDQAALDRLCRVQLGKTILFTDNADWLDEDIVLAYRSQYHIENAFRQTKNS